MPQRFIVSFGSSVVPDEWTDFRCTNTLYFQGVSGATSGEAVAQSIADAYAATESAIILKAIQVKAYDFDGVTPTGAPVAVATADQTAITDPAPGPREVCCALSYRAGPGPRGRGRIYVGPISGGQLGGEYVPGGVGNAVNQLGLRLANIVTLGAEWSLYSRTVQGFASILSWSVDNAWDTQRSRGLPATAIF